MSKKYRELVADFETTTDPDDCRVWAWAIADVSPDPTVTFGTTIDEFLEDIQHWSARIWFHNLKFDAAFIIDWLLRNGFQWSNDTRRHPFRFGGLISHFGEHYQLWIKWGTGHTTILQDSLKKITTSVEAVAETYDLPIRKGDLDVHKHRPPGYEPTTQEWDYVRHDVMIMGMAMYQRLKVGRKLTIGSDALADFKQIMGKDHFDNFFPVLPHEMDQIIRLAYRGGFTYVNPRFQNRVLGTGSVYDVNSLYPHVMDSKPLPYGLPVWFDGYPPHNGLYIVSITFTARIREDHIPTIQIKDNMIYSPTEYLTHISEPTTMVVTNVDLELMHEHYHLNILAFNGGYAFQHVTGVFKQYIKKWSTIKETTTGGRQMEAKLFLNSLYGKFATNPDVTGKYPELDENTDTVRLVTGDPEQRDPVYTAMGVFITSWARDMTIRAAQQNYDTFAYADTDSLHLMTTDAPKGLDVHPTRLGAWDHEYNFTRAKFLRPKRYAEELADGSTVVRIAGAPENITARLQIDDMVEGNTFPGKLQPKRVPGGIVLVETTYTLD